MIYFPSLKSAFDLNVKRLSGDRCWIWKGNFSGHNGIYYGSMSYKGHRFKAHRLAYEFYHDRKIPNGVVIRHSCDNSMCCNPLHLEAGSTQDNVDDKMQRGRFAARKSRVKPVDKRFRVCN